MGYDEGMPWRNSLFFDHQFAAILQDDDATTQAFAAEIRNASTDEPLLVFADWLEERGDSRAQYVRDMCALAAGERPLDVLVDRVNDFEVTLETGGLLFCRTIGDCWLFSLTKEKVLSTEDIDELKQTLSRYIEKAAGLRVAVLDLGRIRYMGSAFLGTLITIHRSMHQQGGDLRLCRLDKALLELFKITRLDNLFAIYDTVDEAVS